MTLARRHQMDLAVIPYYHCVSRCVRRSFLCGYDHHNQCSYEHRRQWVESRIHQLAQIYCIDICSYAVMSNHYHLIVHINRKKAQSLTDEQVIERWSTEHKIDPKIALYQHAQLTEQSQVQSCQALVNEWRYRLSSLSWMMRELNMSIALRANKEDDCTGHFWEGRYKSQALLDQDAVLAGMTYVDLNPVRAGIAQTPEASEYTSLKLRLDTLLNRNQLTTPLFPFAGENRHDVCQELPFSFQDYIQWIDWVSQQIQPNKSDWMLSNLPCILDQIEADSAHFMQICTQIEQKRRLWIGKKETLIQAKQTLKKQRMSGLIV